MYLEQIIIKNFRLFEALNVKLNPGLNLLAGENDAGKTALLDSIRYALGTNSLDRAYINEEDFYKDQNSLSIQLKFTEIGKYAHIFVEHLTHEEYEDGGVKKYKPVLYVHFVATKTEKEKRGYPVIKTEIKSGIDGSGPMLEYEIRNFLSTTYLKPLRDAEAELSTGKGSRLSQILGSSNELRDIKSVDDILNHIAKANKEILKEDKAISNASKKIQDDYLHKLVFEEDKNLLHAIIDIAGIKEEQLPHLTDSQKRRHLRSVLESLHLSLSKERKKHGLGYHNILFMATELLLLEQSEDEFPLLLIEEPEAHLHPQLQMKLLQFILSKSKNEDLSNKIQCILTTHSPNISSKTNPNNIILVSKGKCFPLRVGETELDGDDYRFLEKFLDVTKANLFFAKGLLLVEGDGENILLPTIAKLLGRPLEDYGVSIVKYDNSGSWKRFAKIFLRNGKDENPEDWNPVKISVLRDLDLWPACAEEKIGKYGFKERKQKNIKHWKDETKPNQVTDEVISIKDKLERQNIKIFISNEWTFEFCLARFGLFDECYEAIHGVAHKGEVEGSEDDKSTYIQSKVKKTDFAYKMSQLLEQKYSNNPQALRKKLPSYIVAAIEHATNTKLDEVKSDESTNI